MTRSFPIPPEEYVPERDTKLPFVIIGDEAYPLMEYLLIPYSADSLVSDEERNFNKRLSRARRCVEHAFGIMAAKWRILSKAIETNENVAMSIVKCICILHNVVIDREGMQHVLTPIYKFRRRQGVRNDGGRPNDRAKAVRKAFARYFDRHRVNRVTDMESESNSENTDNPDSSSDD